MKKHLLLLFLLGIFTLSSCSSDDDATDENSIVGTWTLQSISPEVININCPQPSTINFASDGTADWSLYRSESDCVLEESSGSWEKNSGNEYTMYVPGFQAVPGTVNFTSANSFTFTTTVASASVVLTFNRQI